MGLRHRLIGLLFAAGLVACRRDPPPPSANVDDAGPPLDELAEGEVVEGKERAHGLPLPRLSEVQARLEGSVQVVSPLTPEQLVGFVRARVKDGAVRGEKGETRFREVVPLAEPTRRLDIQVRSVRLVGAVRSEMTVRDVTPVPPDPKLTIEQLWNEAGLTPSGEILDPKRLE
jgi:hypothetical protein